MDLTVNNKDGSSFIEKYQLNPVCLVVGNLMMGERYIEPQGGCKLINKTTGETCDVEFKQRSTWTTKEEDKNYVTVKIFDSFGNMKYIVEGKYT